tara:strand:- start:296 stop:565 length:270 start_codon:yes stop_codon:yes gene_type:complete
MSKAEIIQLSLKVIPEASKDVVVGWYGDGLKIKVKAPPEAGKANNSVEAVLATALHLHKRDVVIVKGHTSANKIVSITGITLSDIKRMI